MTVFQEFGLCAVTSFIVASLALNASEPSDNCVTSNTRCNLGAAEICGSDHNWYVNIDCEEISETVDWVCCWLPEDPDLGIPAGHSCVQATTCPE